MGDFNPKKAKRLFFFFKENDVDDAFDKYGRETISGSKCFVMSTEAWEKLTKLDFEPSNFENYFPKNKRLALNQLSREWAASWYKGESKIFGNLSLSLHNYFSKRLFQITTVENLLKKEAPAAVFLGREKGGLRGFLTADFESIAPVIRFFCTKMGVKLIDQSPHEIWSLKFFIQFLRLPKIKKIDFRKSLLPTIIFTSHHYHIVNCLSLLKQFKKSGQYDPLIIGRIGKAQKSLESNNLKFIDYNGEINLKMVTSYLYKKLQFAWEIFAGSPVKKVFKFGNYDLLELFRMKLISLFLSDAPKLTAHQLFFENLLTAIKPAALVAVANDSSIQTLITAAKKEDIPTLEIEHGFSIGEDGVHLKADKFAVWGQVPKAIYQKEGLAAEKMVICGWPAFERYKKIRLKPKKFNRNPFTISFLAQDPEGMSLLFMDKTPQKNLEIFFKVVSMLNIRSRIIVRLHPRADKNFPSVIAKKYNVDFQLSENESLNNLLLKTNIVVGQTTTATLDAIIMHKPVIYLPSMRWPAKFVERTGAVIEVNDVSSLRLAIKRIVVRGMSKEMQEAQKEFVEKYCNFSKDSNKLIAKTILEMIDGKR